jgi:hypothetical protein
MPVKCYAFRSSHQLTCCAASTGDRDRNQLVLDFRGGRHLPSPTGSVSSASWSSSSKYLDEIFDSPFPRSPSVVLEGLSLEELSDVFRIYLAKYAKFGIEQAGAFSNWCLSQKSRWPVLLKEEQKMVVVEHTKHECAEEGDVPMDLLLA